MHTERNSLLRITSRGDQGALLHPRLDAGEADDSTTATTSIAITRGSPNPQSAAWSKASRTSSSPVERRRDAGIVDPLVLHLGPRLVDLEPGDQDGEGGDRDVEEEDPPPAQLVGQHAAQERPHRVADSGRAEDQPARQPRLALRQRRVGHARGSPATSAPRRSPSRPSSRSARGRSGASAAEQREAGEERGAEEERPPAAEQVGEPPAGDDRHPEHEAVGVDDPLRRCRRRR